MKKSKLILLLLSLAIFIIACEKVEEAPKPVEESETIKEEIQPKESEKTAENLHKFDELYNKEDTLALVNFIDENIKDVNREDATDWIDKLETRLLSEEFVNVDKVFELDPNLKLMEIDGTSRYFSPSKIEDIEDEELRQFLQELFDSHYRLINVEGAFYPIVDHKSLTKYNEYIDSEMSEYLDIKALDSEKYPFSDGGRVISLEDLKDRIIQSEIYLSNYREGRRTEEMANAYMLKLKGYMEGLPNTLIYEYNTREILPEYKDSFYEISTLENLETGKVVKRYLEDIENNNSIIDEEIIKKVDIYVDEAVKNIITN